jgi:hypothetical protein
MHALRLPGNACGLRPLQVRRRCNGDGMPVERHRCLRLVVKHPRAARDPPWVGVRRNRRRGMHSRRARAERDARRLVRLKSSPPAGLFSMTELLRRLGGLRLACRVLP